MRLKFILILVGILTFEPPCGKTNNVVSEQVRHKQVSQFILAPGQLGPQGLRYPRAAWPPGAKISRGILAPTLGILAPGGQDKPAGGQVARGYLGPHLKLICELKQFMHINALLKV